VAEDVVKSVGRVFEVLELWRTAREPLNATQVERQLNYPQSSTLALLKSLVKLGYLSFDRIERTYFPTMRVAHLGEWLETSVYGNGQLPALIEEVSDRTGETVSLSCQNDLQMQFVQIRPGSKPLMVNIQVGAFAPLFSSTVGWTALSIKPDADIAKLVGRQNRRSKPAELKASLPAVMEQVEQVRARGYGIGFDTYVHSVGAVAWVLPGDNQTRPLVLSVAGPSDAIRAEADHIVRSVRAAFKACF